MFCADKELLVIKPMKSLLLIFDVWAVDKLSFAKFELQVKTTVI